MDKGMAAPGRRIAGFDGLRALSFLLVFVSHKVPIAFTERYGTLGVWIFFGLSGFLITRILASAREGVEAGRQSPARALLAFYVHRTARIFPLYYVFLLVVTVAGAYGLVETGEPGRVLSYWVYLANVYVERHGWATELGHLWSLSVEEQFYLLFAPVVLWLPRRLLPALCAVLVAVSLVMHGVLRGGPMQVVVLDANSLLNFGLLAAGGLAGLSADHPLPAWLRSTPAIAACGLAILLLPAPFGSEGAWLQVGRVSGVLIALLLVQLYQAQGSLAVAVLNVAPLRFLGVISYAAYLFHPVIRSAELAPWLGLPWPVSLTGAMLADFVLTLGLATLSWFVLERPSRAAIIGAFAPRRAAGHRLA